MRRFSVLGHFRDFAMPQDTTQSDHASSVVQVAHISYAFFFDVLSRSRILLGGVDFGFPTLHRGELSISASRSTFLFSGFWRAANGYYGHHGRLMKSRLPHAALPGSYLLVAAYLQRIGSSKILPRHLSPAHLAPIQTHFGGRSAHGFSSNTLRSDGMITSLVERYFL